MRRYLEPYNIAAPVDYLIPILQHGCGIDIARDVNTAVAAQQFSNDIIAPMASEGKTSNMEWIQAARDIFTEVVKVFQKQTPEEWRFIDVLEACIDESNLRRVLSLSRTGRSRLNGVLGNSKQARVFCSTCKQRRESSGPLASAMLHTRNISLREWAFGPESVAVLQHHEEYSDALRGFERWIFGRAVKLAIAAGTPRTRRPRSSWTRFATDRLRII